MLVCDAKLQGTKDQYQRLDPALRTGLFVRNTALRYWLDGQDKRTADLNKYCRVLAKEYPWAKKLNSLARQAIAKRAWSAISRFDNNCKQKVKDKTGFPRFKRLQTRASVAYKTSGWRLSDCRRYLTFTDDFEAGAFKLWGTRDLHFYQLNQIKRVRVVRRADGYDAQFCIDHQRQERRDPTGKTIVLWGTQDLTPVERRPLLIFWRQRLNTSPR